MPAKINLSIYFHWEYWKQHLTLKLVSKPKATRSTFAIQEITLNEEEVSNLLDIPNVTKIEAVIAKNLKTPLKKYKKQKDQMTIKIKTILIEVAHMTET